MSSRQEEKERRRQERMAREQAEAQSAARKQRLFIVLGVVLGIAAVALAVVAIVSAVGGGEKGKKGSTEGPKGAAGIKPVAIPPAQNADLDSAVKEAGCTLEHFPSFGREHSEAPQQFRTNPPTSGTHNPVPAEDGSYAGEAPPATEATVHSLEHGRINIQYRPGLPPRQLGQLLSLHDEEDAYHVLLFQNRTKMPYAVAATAWTHLLGCKKLSPKTFDAIRAFRARYVDKAPEQVP